MVDAPPRHFPERADPLGETLYSLRLNGVIYAQSELRAPWGLEMPAMADKMMFHIVTQGSCWLRFHNGEATLLQPGELALIPRGEGHFIASDPGMACEPFFNIPVTLLSERFEFMRYGGEGGNGESSGENETLLICGVLSCNHAAGQKLVAQLPQIIYLTREEVPKQLQTLIQLMSEEVMTLSPGGETVVSNLADIIVIQALRHWIAQAPEAAKGWLGALKDPKIGKALTAIHARPAYTWTVERLAEQAGMSRSGFSARFTDIIGTSVKQYVTEWRMGLARMRIMQSPVSLIELAEELGYQSEAAFSRAYKRVFGEPPLRQKS